MTMRRREFLTAGATAAAAAALPINGYPQQVNGPKSTRSAIYPAELRERLPILHKNAPDRILWETVANGTFITAEGAVANIKDFGTPMGFFSITNSVSASYENPMIDKIEIAGCDGDGVWKANARRRQRSI